MKCPRCESPQLRKNGRANAKQRYLCKACGRQFLRPLSAQSLSEVEIEAVKVTNNGHVQATLPQKPPLLQTYQQALALPAQKALGIAILLLDAENLNIDIKAEKFLAKLCNCPLHVKIAFANWRNPAVGKQDAKLHERGYQLVHVPGGKNSADAQMIATGVSVSRHYPDAQEIFVCSCDRLLTNLCNELQSQGLTVYRVLRKDNNLIVENRNTNNINYYSLNREAEIPSFEGFFEKIEELLKTEQKSICERIAQLSTVTALFQERCNLSNKKTRSQKSEALEQASELITDVTIEETTATAINTDKIAQKSPVCTTTESPKSLRIISSQEEFELVLSEIINTLQLSYPQDKISVSRLSVELRKMCGENANEIVKRLNIGVNSTKFLQSCPRFTLEKNGRSYVVGIAQISSEQKQSRAKLEKILIKLMNNLIAKSSQKQIPLESLGSEFHKQYNQPVSAMIKQLNLECSFLDFVESCSCLKLEKKGKGYQVGIR